MHLLLQLDLRDSLVPIEAKDTPLTYLPLYYPLRYGWGGGEVQYSVDSDEKITILSPLHEERVDNGTDYSFPDYFPQLPVTLVPLKYRQHRAIVAFEHGSNHYSKDAERKADLKILQQIDSGRMIRLGTKFSPIQCEVGFCCGNPKCDLKGKNVRAEIFAEFTDALTDEISIWSAPGKTAYVEIYFALLSCCNTIVAVNQCT